MEIRELRIGNYVFDIDGDVLQVGEILDIGVKFKKTSLASRYEKINPIPLTEEILLKFGFEKQHNEDDFDYWFKKGFCDDILWEHSDGFCHSLNYGGDIKYVHQLQNLYFALTGEELTFKKD